MSDQSAPAHAEPRVPPATRDIVQAEADLKTHGICIIEGALDEAALRRVHETIYRVADNDALRLHEPDFPLDHGTSNQRIWNLPSRDPVFVELAEHPLVIRLLRSLLGWPVLLSSFSANIAGPGGDDSEMHADQFFVPGHWDTPQSVNFAWVIDDFTQENGATTFVAGSHLLGRNPRPEEQDLGEPLIAKAGTLVAFEGRLWHKTGINTTSAERRAGLFANYTRNIYRTQENWFLSLDRSVVQTASKTLLALLGYHTEGLGMVNGVSPLWQKTDYHSIARKRGGN